MKNTDNFLSSGHHFTADENLLKFRFSFLNGLLLVALFFNCLNYVSSLFGFIDLGRSFENAITADTEFINMSLVAISFKGHPPTRFWVLSSSMGIGLF